MMKTIRKVREMVSAVKCAEISYKDHTEDFLDEVEEVTIGYKYCEIDDSGKVYMVHRNFDVNIREGMIELLRLMNNERVFEIRVEVNNQTYNF